MGQIGYFGKGNRFVVSKKQVFTFSDFERTTAGRYESHDRIGLKPLTERIGPGLCGITFTIALSSSLGVNPRHMLDKWQQLADAGVVDVIVVGNKRVGKNKWLLKSVSESWKKTDGKGNVISAVMDLTFEEYVEK